MSEPHVNECLPFTDAFFLYLEQQGAPINVAAISAFEGIVPLDQCMQYVESKLPLIPRFLQRVVIPPLNIGPPTLQYDSRFDVRNHIREIKLEHGSDSEWKSVVSDILSTHLDRSRPLWDMTLLHGLKENRTGIVVRMHHCLVDGIAGVSLLNVLLDPSPVTAAPKRKKLKVPTSPPHDPATEFLDTLINSCFTTGQALLTAHSELLQIVQQASRGNGNARPQTDDAEAAISPLARIAPLSEFARLLSELAQPTQRLPYNILCRGPQKFDWTEISMAEIAAVRQACTATINEVVLTVLTAALRRYAELHKVGVKGRKLRIVIPVNIRKEADSGPSGNQITFLPVDIPCSGRDPRKLLSLVQKRVKFSKTAHAADLVTMAGMVIGATPPPLQAMAGAFLRQLPISVCNSICTNVPGPKTPLYLLGHKMVSSYPCVPIGGEMGMNCAVLSYDGTLFVGFTGDAQAIPDLAVLATLFSESFAELRDAVGIHLSTPEAPRRKTRKAAGKPRQAAGASSAVDSVAGGAVGNKEAPGEGVNAVAMATTASA